MRPVLVCLADDASFLAGDEVDVSEFLIRGAITTVGHGFVGTFPAFSVRTNATQVITWITVGNTLNELIMVMGDGSGDVGVGTVHIVHLDKWNYKVYVAE